MTDVERKLNSEGGLSEGQMTQSPDGGVVLIGPDGQEVRLRPSVKGSCSCDRIRLRLLRKTAPDVLNQTPLAAKNGI